MKPPKIAVRPYKHSLQWKFVIDLRAYGKGRLFFKTQDEANAEAMRQRTLLEQHSREAVGLSARELSEIIHARTDLAQYGKTISEAAKHYIAHLKASERSCTVAWLVDNFIAKKKKVTRRRLPASNDYLVDLNVRLGRFKRDFGERTVATIESAEIEDWLDSLKDERTGEYLSPTSQGNYHRALTVLFAYAVKGMFAKRNPLANIDRSGGDSTPGILSVEQAARLLGCASAEILPYIAIGLFAGLRASELERLRWEHIDFEENEISVINPGGRHKSRRHVDMLPNLRAWLLPLRKLSGTIMPENFRKHFDAVREAAGVIPWPDNALRHSFGSYHLRHFGNDALTRLQMGHWRESDVLFTNYRQAVKKRDAERYWKIEPAGEAKVVAFAK